MLHSNCVKLNQKGWQKINCCPCLVSEAGGWALRANWDADESLASKGCSTRGNNEQYEGCSVLVRLNWRSVTNKVADIICIAWVATQFDTSVREWELKSAPLICEEILTTLVWQVDFFYTCLETNFTRYPDKTDALKGISRLLHHSLLPTVITCRCHWTACLATPLSSAPTRRCVSILQD